MKQTIDFFGIANSDLPEFAIDGSRKNANLLTKKNAAYARRVCAEMNAFQNNDGTYTVQVVGTCGRNNTIQVTIKI